MTDNEPRLYGTGTVHGAGFRDGSPEAPTDPTPTPTPQEVLARAIHEQWRRDVGIIDPARWEDLFADERDGLMRQADACLAACLVWWLGASLAATGDAPLSAEEFNQLDEDAGNNGDWETPFWKLRSAYLTLAAQLATARAERDALRERVESVLKEQAYYGGGTAEDLAERVNAALLATPARPTDTTP